MLTYTPICNSVVCVYFHSHAALLLQHITLEGSQYKWIEVFELEEGFEPKLLESKKRILAKRP